MKRAFLGLSVLLALSVNGAAPAAAAIPIPADDNREASFLPPPVVATPEGQKATDGQATPQAPSAQAAAPAQPEADRLEAPIDLKNLNLGNSTRAETKDVASSPPLVTPPAAPQPVTVIEGKKETTPAAPVQAASVQSAPVQAASVQSAPVQAVPVQAAPAQGAAAGIASKPLAEVDPEAIGLLAQSNGGLGASLWKDTPRALVDKLLPTTGLPTASPTLNDLARRMLLTTAAVPVREAGTKSPQSLSAMRVERLVALGDAPEAWKLAMLAEPDKMDEIALRLLSEVALLGEESGAVCDKLPGFIAAHNKPDETGIEWQKTLIICKLRAKDDSAVQLGLDLLREQGAKDDLFLTLMNRNVLAGAKQLPRQLTPLRATSLAVLRQIDLPLPPELYARPEAALVPELLKAKASDEKARLALAEKAAAKGSLSPAQLADVYKSVVLSQDEGAAMDAEHAPKARAALYQAALREPTPSKKIDIVQKLVLSSEGDALAGSLGVLAADLVADIAPGSDYNLYAGTMARLMALAGKTDRAMAWLQIARGVEGRLPEVGKQMVRAWPLFALSGLVADGDYAAGFKTWLDQALAPDEDKEGKESKDDRARREQVGRLLLVLSASGYAVPDEAWVRVIEATPPTKQLAAPALLEERLRAAGLAGRRGETVLLALLVASGGAAETPIGALADTIRALRQVGLTAEAQGLAREVVAGGF